MRFDTIAERNDPSNTPLSAELLLRNTIRQPDITRVLEPTVTGTIHLRLSYDTDRRPVDSVHIHGYSDGEDNAAAGKLIWHALGDPRTAVPESLGRVNGHRSTPLAITQMNLQHHLLNGAR